MTSDKVWRFTSMGAVLRLALALTAVAPVTCQNEAEPYFSLSSSRTFSSQDKPQISMSAYGVKSVQVRVYRVNDAVEFTRKLGDLHTFGGRMPRPAGKLSLLERVHNWKRGLRRDIRLQLRGQFSESPSAHLFPRRRERKPVSARTPAQFAEIPLLNKEQVVLSFTQAVSSDTRWNSQQIALPVKSKGLYLVEAVNDNLRAYTILMVSDAVLLTKTGRDHTLGYFVDRRSGEPIADAPVSVMAGESTPRVVKTGSDGVADLTTRLKEPEDIKIFAQRGADVALSSIASWNFSARERNLTGLIYSDRPVYRPGDPIHFRAIVRTQESIGYSTPARKTFTVQITDPDGKPVYQKELSSNGIGVFHDSWTSAKQSALGTFYVEAKSGENSISGSFEIQEYKKPEYEVRVTPSQPRVIQGATVSTTVDSRYYFGEPVSGAKVKYTVYRSAYWSPVFYRDENEEGEAENEGDGSAGEEVSAGEGTTDPDGKLVVNLSTAVSDAHSDSTYRLEARVTDPAGREISGTGYVVATYGSFAVNIEPNRYFFEPNTTGSFKVEARDYDGKPVSAAVQVALERWNWRNRDGGQVVSNGRGATDANGTTSVDLAIPGGGTSYRAVISARTPEGRTVRAYTYVWVESGGAGIFDGERTETLQIVPDKKTYRPGETARILIVGVQDRSAVLTAVEGRDVRAHKVIRASGQTALFEHVITADEEPGFYLSAQYVRDGKLYSGSKLIKIPPEEHQINLEVTTDKPTYLPGQTGRYQLAATTFDGKPVANADLSLGVVDEAIYAIRRDTTPDLLRFFYGREYNSVYTESSLTYFFSGEAGTRRMRLAMLRPESSLAQLKPERVPQPKVRKYFPDTAFWAADLTTDGSGRAQATLTFPDSLTTWRATVRGVAENRFGSATAKTVVRKNLILRLAAPRFLIGGDEVTISGIVHNYLAEAKQVKVKLNVSGLDLVDSPPSAEIRVDRRAEATVRWRVKARQAVRGATLNAQALTDEESDALEVQLPVNPPGIPARQARGGTLADSSSATVAFTFPSDAVNASRSLSVRMAPSIAGSLFGALDYLTSFPYGCVEQTMSSFLPNLAVSKAVENLRLKMPGNPAALPEKTQAGINRLYAFQHEDGGWGWWQTDDSHPFMTAYVVAGLSEAKRFAIAIEDERITRGAAWTARQLTTDKTLGPDLRAYMLYALELASQPERNLENAAYRSRSELSPYGLALLGLTFEAAHDSRAKALADQLASTAQTNSLEAWWKAERDEMLDFTADVSPEATAYAVKLLSHQRPRDPLLPKAALWLVDHRSEGYWWSSSKQTAMVIYGLVDYLKAGRELQPDLKATVKVNGNAVLTRKFQSASLADEAIITVPEDSLDRENNRVEVTSSGTGRLYYSVSAQHFSNAARVEKQGTVSLNLLRDYYRLNRVPEGDHFVYDLVSLKDPVEGGDTIAVRLTVTGTDARYLLVEDPIPAGTEFIEQDNLYHLRNRPPWWRYWFTRRELHDDRMAIFQTRFDEGQQQYFYLLKVVNPGQFQVGPARVEPMYQPGIRATTESRVLEAR